MSDNLDPRFDPAFQRGFEGDVTATRRRASPGVPQVIAAADAAARQSRVVTEVPPPPPADSPPRPPVPIVETRTDAEPQVARSHRPNPFVIGLWVIGVALIAVGSWGLQWSISTVLQVSNSSSGDGISLDLYSMQIVQNLSPFGIALGALTVIGLGFFHAASWSRR